MLLPIPGIIPLLVGLLVISASVALVCAEGPATSTSLRRQDQEQDDIESGLDSEYWDQLLAAADPITLDHEADQRRLAAYLPDYSDWFLASSHNKIQCIGRALKIDRPGEEVCLHRGEGICTDEWQFGIFSDYSNDNSFALQLWEEGKGGRKPVYEAFHGATELCISAKHPEISLLYVKTDHGLKYLLCPDLGKKRQYPHLKLRKENDGNNNKGYSWDSGEEYDDDDDPVVAYVDGGDKNWRIFDDGDSKISKKCRWLNKPQQVIPPKPSPPPPSEGRCGDIGLPCCKHGYHPCGAGQVCGADHRCRAPCGFKGGVCCAGGRCDGDLICSSHDPHTHSTLPHPTCVHKPVEEDKDKVPCNRDGTCPYGYICKFPHGEQYQAAHCTACGGSSKPCCPHNQCNHGFVCDYSTRDDSGLPTCQPCGSESDRCCIYNSRDWCDAGLSCDRSTPGVPTCRNVMMGMMGQPGN